MTNSLSRLAAALMLGAAAAPLSAQSAPPAPGIPKSFRIPAHRTITLMNGMRITFIHYGTVPKAVVRLQLGTGVVDEPPFGPGLAGLTADMLLQATIVRTGADISREAAEMGGGVSATAGPVATTVEGEVLSEHTSRFVKLLADVARHPRLDSADFERVRLNAIRNLAITMQNAGDQARQQFRAMLFPGHPFGHPYSREATLKALQLGHVRNFFDDNYGAARAHLYVSGVFDDAEVELAARQAFSDWARGVAEPERPAKPVAHRQLELLDRPDAPQSTLWVGLPVIDPKSADYVPFEVANALLGGAFGSRITNNIREDKGYTYSPYSLIWAHPGASYWVEMADVTTSATGASLKEIFGEIDRLRREPPPAEELEGIKQNVVGLFTIQNSSRAGMVGQLAFVEEHGLGEDFLTSYVRTVLAVKPDDVRRVANAYLDPDRMTIAVVGDRKSVEAQVAPYRPKVVP